VRRAVENRPACRSAIRSVTAAAVYQKNRTATDLSGEILSAAGKSRIGNHFCQRSWLPAHIHRAAGRFASVTRDGDRPFAIRPEASIRQVPPQIFARLRQIQCQEAELCKIPGRAAMMGILFQGIGEMTIASVNCHFSAAICPSRKSS